MHENLRKSINTAFDVAINNANATFATAMAAATTSDQKLAITTARQNSVSLSISARNAALEAAGDKPAKPVKKVKLDADHDDDEIKLDKLDKPEKPTKPVKPGKHVKSNKTLKG